MTEKCALGNPKNYEVCDVLFQNISKPLFPSGGLDRDWGRLEWPAAYLDCLATLLQDPACEGTFQLRIRDTKARDRRTSRAIVTMSYRYLAVPRQRQESLVS